MFNVLDRRTAGYNTTFAARQLPVSGAALRSRAYDYTVFNSNINGREAAQVAAVNRIVREAANASDGSEDDYFDEIGRNWSLYIGDKSRDEFPEGATFAQAQYLAARKLLEGRGYEPPAWQDVETMAMQIADMSIEEFNMARQLNYSDWPGLQSVAGALGASFRDPMVLTTLALTSFIGIGAAPLAVAGTEFGIGVAGELVTQAQMRKWYEDRGVEYPTEGLLLTYATAGLLPATVSGALSAGVRRFTGVREDLFPGIRDAMQVRLVQENAEIDRLQRLKYRQQAEQGIRALEDVRPGTVTRADVEAERNRQSLGAMPEPQAEIETVATNNGLDATFEARQVSGPYVPMTTPMRMVELAFDVTPGTEAAHRAWNAATAARIQMSNPAINTPFLKYAGHNVDNLSLFYNPVEQINRHMENLNAVTSAIVRGERIPDVPHTKELSTYLSSGVQDVRHRGWAKELFERGIDNFSLRSKAMREFVAEVLLQEYGPQLERLRRTLDEGPQPARAAAAARPSRLQPEDITERLRKVRAEQRKVEKQLSVMREGQRKLGAVWKAEQRALWDDLEPPERPQGYVEPDVMAAKIATQEKRAAKMQEQVDTLLQQRRQNQIAAASQKERGRVNAALAADTQLKQLLDGQVPKELKDVATRLAGSLEQLRKSENFTGYAMDEGAQRAYNVTLRNFKNAVRVDFLDAAQAQARRVVRETPSYLAAQRAEMERLAPEFTFTTEVDGELRTFNRTDLEDLMKQEDEAVQALSVCNTGGGAE